MPKKSSVKGFDAAGWGFWLVCFVVLFGPIAYGVWQIAEEDAQTPVKLGIATVTTAISAGLVSWAANAVIQFFAQRRRKATRKKSRKKK